MRRVRYLQYLWPGLADLWRRGTYSGLVLAGTFSLLVGFVLSATWVWDELLGRDRGGAIWGGFAIGWASLLIVSWRRVSRSDGPITGRAADAFPPALVQYLRGNWIDAETAARKLLKQYPSDIEAALLLAAVLRHTNRIDEARETLDAAGLWDRASAWQVEIATEYQRLSEKENRLLEEEPSEPIAGAGPSKEEEEQEMQADTVADKTLPEWRRAA